MCKGGIHFGSCYLQCNWGHNRTFNLDLLQCMGALLATLSGPWIIGGDWQCPPDELRSTGWLKTVKGVNYAPEASLVATECWTTSSPRKTLLKHGPSSLLVPLVMQTSVHTARLVS